MNLERGLGLFGLTQNKKVQIKFKASKQNIEVILGHGSSLPHWIQKILKCDLC